MIARFLFFLIGVLLTAGQAPAQEGPGKVADLIQRFVVPPESGRIHHAPTLARLADGTLLCAWYSGSNECARDVQIYASRLAPGAPSWTAGVPIVKAGERAEGRMLRNKSVGNPVVFCAADNVVWLFYAALPFGGWSMAHVDYKTSTDGGVSWSESRTLVDRIGHLPRNRPLPLAENRILLPLYRETFGKRAYVMEVGLNGRRAQEQTQAWIPGKALQPALARLGATELVAYLRDPKERGLLFSRTSASSLNWSEPEYLSLPNPGAAVDVLSLSDGRLLLAFNNDPDDRNPLSLATTLDGKNFRVLSDIEKRKEGKFAYPTLLRAPDGTIHLVYSFDRRGIKHVEFTEEWLRQLEARPSVQL